MRAVSAHEGTHLVQEQRLAASYDATSGKYSASLNMTKLTAERQVYSVENKINGQYSSQKIMDEHLKDTGYKNFDQTLLPSAIMQ